MIKRFGKQRYLRVIGLAVGAVAVAGSAVIVTASAAGIGFGFHTAGAPQGDASLAAAQATVPR